MKWRRRPNLKHFLLGSKDPSILDPKGPPWKQRPYELMTGVGYSLIGMIIFGTGGEAAPRFFKEQPIFITLLYAGLATIGGLLIIYGLCRAYRGKDQDRFVGYRSEAIGHLMGSLFVIAYAWGYISNPPFQMLSSSTIILVLGTRGLAGMMRALNLLHASNFIRVTIHEAVTQRAEGGDH